MPGVEVNKTKEIDRQENCTIVLILTILTSIILLFFVDMIIARVVHEPVLDKAYIQKMFIVPLGKFNPEAVERTQFISDIFLYPIFCLFFFLLFDRLVLKLQSLRRWLYYVLSATVLIFLVFLANKGLKEIVSGAYLYIHSSFLFYRPTLTIAIGLMTLLAILLYEKMIQQRLAAIKIGGEVIYYLVGLGLLILIASETVFNEAVPGAIIKGLHFLAVFGPMQRVFAGGTLLVNVNSEYGMFPLFLKPAFQIVGLSVFKFTFMMGILRFISFGSLFILLHQLIKNRVIALCGFTSVVFFLRISLPMNIGSDPYFAYDPIRFLFPMLFILLVFFYINNQREVVKKIALFTLSIFSSLAILWNPDTGIVVFITWLIVLIYQELLDWRNNGFWKSLSAILKKIGWVLVCLAVVLIAFALYTFFSSGSWPNLPEFTGYLNLFYADGYFMIPMPLVHPWNLVILIYMLGLFFSIRNFCRRNAGALPSDQPDRETERGFYTLILALSILGVGLFSYYQGRSHDFNLIDSSWPALILLILFVDVILARILAQFKEENSWKKTLQKYAHDFLPNILFLAVFLFLITSIPSTLWDLPDYLQLISSRLEPIHSGLPDTFKNEIDFIQANADQNSEILILSYDAPVRYLYTRNLKTLPIPGFGEELIWRKDLDEILGYLNNPGPNTRIFWQKGYAFIDPNQYPNLTLAKTIDWGNMELFVKK